MAGIGWNVVEDDGRAMSHHLDVNNAWSYLPYPATLSFDYYLKRGLSLEFIGSYNEYSDQVLVNDSIGRPGQFIGLELNCKYSFYRFFEPTKWFDPYVSLGAGLAYRTNNDEELAPFINVNGGANFWIIKRLGIRLQTSGHVGFIPGFLEDDYFQHSASIVYRHPVQTKIDNSFRDKKHKKLMKQKYRYKGKGI